ncbi:hypothetical protein GGS23DRAFT_13103 [Durotheca rogersii]|uniref:uncharacterized protein n=1 Tax=Durotheca rogersii TaxID=419775 RepID=UPI00221FCFB9|nr:uncharacterized protein GGS23DRAFT_13103 [Durotheca rogersii]KAI5868131.1 hypothetical protein GGS23DRAFT_13103 [Durotheca rogersii]
MVQDAGHPRDSFPSRPAYWPPQERFPMEPIPDESRFTDSPDVRRPPVAIDKALREYCNISAEFYVLISFIDGKPHIFTAPNSIATFDIKRFLNMNALTRELQRSRSSKLSKTRVRARGMSFTKTSVI